MPAYTFHAACGGKPVKLLGAPSTPSAMSKVAASVIVAKPRVEVFCLTQDYYLRKEWDPFLREIRFLGGATAPAAGVGVFVRAWNGLAMTVEYVSYRPCESVAIKMTAGPWFLASFGGVWRFSDAAGGGTEVTFEYGYRMRGGLLGRMLDPAVRWAFGRDVRARLAGLRRAAEETDLLARLGPGCA